MRLTYIRWSMTIIEALGVVIVTDPVFRVLGLRQAPTSYTIDQMPRPHLVFVSHTHVDHYEPAVLKQLPPKRRSGCRPAARARPRLWGCRAYADWILGIKRSAWAPPYGRAGQA